MRLLYALLERVSGPLFAGIILAYLFQPGAFVNGVTRIDWFLFIKILSVIVFSIGWTHLTIQRKTSLLLEDISALKKELQGVREMVDNKILDHFYTIDENERIRAIQNHGYGNENIACYVFPVEKGKEIEGAAPLYRLYAGQKLL